MGSDELRVERADRVITITLDRPGDQNRLTRDVLLGLQQVVDRLGGDDEAQAVVITGGGREFFSMGILNPTVRASYTKEQILEMVRLANRLYDAIETLPQIVIAALHGAARAGAGGPIATRGGKGIMNARMVSGFTAARTLSDALRHAHEWSHDIDEGMVAHREGRTPRFSGR